jgi:hypothetical protein
MLWLGPVPEAKLPKDVQGGCYGYELFWLFFCYYVSAGARAMLGRVRWPLF